MSFSQKALFFALFQSMAQVIVLKSSDFSKEHLASLKLLNIQRLVSSSLNPLSVCPENLIIEFSKICSHLQLAMCSAIIQRNSLTQNVNKKQNGPSNDEYLIWLPFHANPLPLTLSKVRPYLSRSSRPRYDSLSSQFSSREDERMSGISFSASPSASGDNEMI